MANGSLEVLSKQHRAKTVKLEPVVSGARGSASFMGCFCAGVGLWLSASVAEERRQTSGTSGSFCR